jgi:hypothetical protein
MKKAFPLLILLSILLFPSCISTGRSAALTAEETDALKSALIATERTALNTLDLPRISAQITEKIEFDASVTCYEILPQYETLMNNLKSDYRLMVEKILNEVSVKLSAIIQSLDIEDPKALLNEGYQSVSWHIEKEYSQAVYEEILALLDSNIPLLIYPSFNAFTQEALIWRQNKIVLSSVKPESEITAVPQAPSSTDIAKLITNTLLNELSFSEQRIRVSLPTELLHE